MKGFIGSVSYAFGILLNVATGLFSVVYLFGAVFWMHAPSLQALIMILFMPMPLFGLAWIFRRVGRSLNSKLKPRPWYRLQENGKIVRYRSGGK